jgi:hypothetical protein
VHGDYQRKSKREKASLSETDLPFLWILASSASENLLSGFSALPAEDWEPGIYLLEHSFRTAIIAINQIPVTEETLLLRT